MDIEALFDTEMAEHAEIAARTAAVVRAPFRHLIEVAAKTVRTGNKILLFGNGDSAASTQEMHITLEHMLCSALERELEFV